MNLVNLEQWVERASRGDREAFKKIYQEFKEMVYRACWAATLEKESTKDLFQEIWLKVYLGFPTLKETRKFPGWLRAIVNRKIIDYIRSKEKEKSVCLSENLDFAQISDPTTTIEVQKLLNYLSPKERYLFYLHYFEGLSLKEIAEELGLNLSTVKMTLHRGNKN